MILVTYFPTTRHTRTCLNFPQPDNLQPQVPQVPGVEGVTVIWPDLQATENPASFRNPGGASRWHTDLVHELQPAGITHLHNDTVPAVGGDTLWASVSESLTRM